MQIPVGILLDYSENDDGEKETEDTSVIYDGNYYFNDQLYAFILGRLSTDGLAEDWKDLDPADPDFATDLQEYEGRAKRDAFIGVGPGYRVISNDTISATRPATAPDSSMV